MTLTSTSSVNNNIAKKSEIFDAAYKDSVLEIKNSGDFRNLQENFSHLEWHANNWGRSFIPFYGFKFTKDFMEYHNSTIEAIIIIKERLLKFDDHPEALPFWRDILLFPIGIVSWIATAADLKDYFWNTISPAYYKLMAIFNAYNFFNKVLR